MPHKYLPCNFTLATSTGAFQFEYSTGIATMSSLAKLCVDMRLTKSGNTYRSANQLKMTARRTLEWMEYSGRPS